MPGRVRRRRVLGGIGLIAYRLVAALTAIMAAGGLIAALGDSFRDLPTFASYGFKMYIVNQPAPPVVDEVLPQAARAARVGRLQVGDTILKVDGVAIPQQTTIHYVGAKLAKSGKVAKLLVRPLHESRAVIRIVRRDPDLWWKSEAKTGIPNPLYYLLNFLGTALIPVVLLTASFILYKKRPHNGHAMALATSFLMMCWMIGLSRWISQYLGISERLPETINTIGLLSAVMGCAAFPDGRVTTWLGRVGFVLAAIALAVALYAPFEPGAPIGGISAILLLLSLAIVVTAEVWEAVTAPAGATRQQLKCFVIGAAITCSSLWAFLIVGMVGQYSDAFHPAFAYVVQKLGPALFYTALPTGLMISILHYRLYDSEAAVARSAAYAGLAITLLVIFTAVQNFVAGLLQGMVAGELGTFPGAVAAAAAALSIGPVYGWFKKRAERRFRRDLFTMREGLPTLMGDLRETSGLDAVIQPAMTRVQRGMRATRLALMLDGQVVATEGVDRHEVEYWAASWTPDPDGGLDCDRYDPGFPLRQPLSAEGFGLVGWLLLGPRPDGSFYSRNERRVLSDVAGAVARAIGIVRRREDFTRVLEDRLSVMESLLTRMRGRPRRFGNAGLSVGKWH